MRAFFVIALLIAGARGVFGAAPVEVSLEPVRLVPAAAITAPPAGLASAPRLSSLSVALGAPPVVAAHPAVAALPVLAAPQEEKGSTVDWLLKGGSRPKGEVPEHLETFLAAEQGLLSREMNGSRFMSAKQNGQDPAYAPEKGAIFELKSWWLDADRARVFLGEGLSPALRDLFLREKDGARQVRLLVHPESEKFYAPLLKKAVPAESFKATPTSSSRSLVVWAPGREKDAFIAKVSLDAQIGGVRRTIPAGEAARSVGINNILAADKPFLPEGFKVFPEVLGVMPAGMPRGGMIIRDIPAELKEGSAQLIPLFSLYARPPPGGEELIFELARRSSMAGAKFVRQRILRPFIRQWVTLAVERGIVMEAHAQNVLMEVGKDGLPTGGFFYRDFGGFNAELDFRAKRGLPVPKDLPAISNVHDDYFVREHGKALSDSLYTFFVGGFVYNLDKLLGKDAGLERALEEEFNAAYEAVTGRKVDVRGDIRKVAEAVLRTRRRPWREVLSSLWPWK